MSDLISAAKNGYHTAVERFLAEGASTETRDKEQGGTALYWGACRGHVEICASLLKARCDVNSQVKWGSSALHAATDRGHIDCVQILITWGANINLQNNRGDTPLHLAAYRGYADIVDVFIDANANPFLQNKSNKTAIQEGQSRGHTLGVFKLQQYMAGLQAHSSLPSTVTDISYLNTSIAPVSWPQTQKQEIPFASNIPDNVLKQISTNYKHLNSATPLNNGCTGSQVPPNQRLMEPTENIADMKTYDEVDIPVKRDRFVGECLLQMPLHDYSSLSSVYFQGGSLQKAPTLNKRTPVQSAHDYCDSKDNYKESMESVDGLWAEKTNSNGVHQIPNKEYHPGVSHPRHAEKQLLSKSNSTPEGRAMLEKFAETLQLEVVKYSEKLMALQGNIVQLQNQLLQVEEQNKQLQLLDVRNSKDLHNTRELLAREKRKNFEVAKQQKLLSRSMVSLPMETRYSSRAPKYEIGHEQLLDVLKSVTLTNTKCNSDHVLDTLKRKLELVWLQPSNSPQIDSMQEWTAGVDFDIIGDGPLNHVQNGMRNGSCSLVFQIRRNGTPFILKMMINLINLDYTKHNEGCSLDGFLIKNFGPEYHVPLLLSKHRNIVNVVHYYQGSTDSFQKYSSLLIPTNIDVPIEMARRTSFLVLESYPQTLMSFMVNQRTVCPEPCYGLPNQFLLLLLYQMLAVIDYLQCNHIVHRDVKGDNVFLDRCLRPVLADFGFARSLHAPSGQKQLFQDKTQSFAGNPHAWAPELTRFHHTGPESLPRMISLQEIYSKSDGYAVSRMFYSLLRPLGDSDSFPQSSVNEPHYKDSSIPSLPSNFSPGFCDVLHSLVLNEPKARPTARTAMLRVGLQLFSPSPNEVVSMDDVLCYLQARSLRLLTIKSPKCDSDKVLNVEESMTVVSPEVEASFLATVTPKEFWEEYVYLKEKKLLKT